LFSRVIEVMGYGSTDTKPLCCLIDLKQILTLKHEKKPLCTTRNILYEILFCLFLQNTMESKLEKLHNKVGYHAQNAV
jgi:hypothetical protein